ncbi:HD domain-containing phosphohydrolase [Rosettibacter firmus]|uniref:HD domain-containing phosphohydrolase n=1 Tax=Rosettibacter firmus TaxID=3111522 RepID=UPI00336C0A7F
MRFQEKILLVDDDENALAGFRRSLGMHFNIFTAQSADEGISLIEKQNNFAVVISDYKMPNMDGNEFLKIVKNLTPDTVRIMLTGYAEINIAIEAVNEGNVFRFLTKPCNTDILIKSVKTAIEQYRLITAEKELLEKTLKGSINLLVDILSLTNPQIFNKVIKLKQMAKNIALKLSVKKIWEVEIAVLLSQIGCIAIPPGILEKKYKGMNLTEEEQKLFESHPKIGKKLLENIPRLETVAEIIAHQFLNEHTFTSPFKDEYMVAAKILNALIDFDFLTSTGKTEQEALELMKKNTKYDPDILTALDTELAGIYDGLTLLSVELEDLKPGVILADDIKDEFGKVLITKGAEISQASLLRLLNFSKYGKIITPIKILVYLEDNENNSNNN